MLVDLLFPYIFEILDGIIGKFVLSLLLIPRSLLLSLWIEDPNELFIFDYGSLFNTRKSKEKK